MSVNLRNYQRHRIQDFSGGINEFEASFTMNDNELQEASNVELRSGGSVRSRKGMPRYNIGTTFSSPVTNMYHYSRFNNDRKVLAYSGATLYHDNDNGTFASFQALTSDDSKCRMAQWREAVFFTTRTGGLGVYDPYDPRATNALGFGHSEFTNHLAVNGENVESLVPSGGAFVTLTPVNTADGVLTNSATYLYRYTFDVYQADTFLGESGVVWRTRFAGPPRTWDAPGAILGPADDTFEIRSNALLAALPRGYKAINIYRSIAPSTVLSNVLETNMVWVGSIPRSLWADTVTAHIVDQGLIAGRSIAPYYLRNERPPYGRHVSTHKSRIWLAHVNYDVYDPITNTFSVQNAPHRVYFSEVNEPGIFLATSWVEIDPTDGSGITGIISYKNKALIVFQANSMWAISGGDEEIGPGIPDISVENISNDIGCVAPESIQICDGRVVWRSHRGIYYFDGTFPKPLATENIDGTILDLVPKARYDDGASIFLSKEREYWFSHASESVNATYQSELSKFSFKNGSWVRGSIASTYGFASFCEKKHPDRAPVVLAGMEASSSDLQNTGAIFYVDVGGYDFTSATPAITWSFRTKFYDCGTPFMDKKFVAVLVQLEAEADVFMQVSCDNHLVDELFTIQNTDGDQDLDADDGVWDESPGVVGTNWSDGSTGSEWTGDNNRNALIYLNSKCWGKRISFRFSGVTTASQIEIQALTIFYDSKEGVRQ